MNREVELPVPWKIFRTAFHTDGSLRDIVVVGTNLGDWERAYEYVRTIAASGVARLESDPDPLPPTLPEIFALQRERGARLEVLLGNVQLNCYFFGELEIEFDLWPDHVRSETEAHSVLMFMQGIGQALRRPVHLTEENMHDWRWLTFDPLKATWTFDPTTPH